MTSEVNDGSLDVNMAITDPLALHMFPLDWMPEPEPEVEVEVAEPPPKRAKRRQVKNACTNCQRACKKCDEARPCLRCVRYGLSELCVDSQRKERKKGARRGPYRKRDVNNSACDTGPAATPEPVAQEPPPPRPTAPIPTPPFVAAGSYSPEYDQYAQPRPQSPEQLVEEPPSRVQIESPIPVNLGQVVPCLESWGYYPQPAHNNHHAPFKGHGYMQGPAPSHMNY
ncbi:hypothetical protein FB107DRAFT_265027 [Schizophyllum commune]